MMFHQKIIAGMLGLAALASGQIPGLEPSANRPAANQKTAPQKEASMGNLNLENASLTAVVDQLARVLKLHIVMDPAVKGVVMLKGYGDTSGMDPRNLLEMVLRTHGFGLIRDGEIYRVVKESGKLGRDDGPGIKLCVAGDDSAAGTIVDGYQKKVVNGMFGPQCMWERTNP